MFIEDVEDEFVGPVDPLPSDYRYILEHIDEPSLQCDDASAGTTESHLAEGCKRMRGSQAAADSSAYSMPVPQADPDPDPDPVTVSVSNTCNISGIDHLRKGEVSGIPSSSSTVHSRYSELQQEALYMSYFVGATAIYDLSEEELAFIMQSHGLKHISSTKDLRRVFVEHLLLGNCFENQHEESEACQSCRDIFDSRKSMTCYLLQSIILNEHDLCRLKEVCRGLGMTDRELYYADEDKSLLRYISYCKDCFSSLPSFDEIACSLDSMPPYDLLMLARLHRVTIENRASFESIKCDLLAHFGEGFCEFNDSNVSPGCNRLEADSEIASRLKLLNHAIAKKIGKRQCERLLSALNVGFDSGLSKRQLLNIAKDEARGLYKGKYNDNRRARRIEEDQIIDKRRCENLRTHDQNWPSPVSAELKNKLISDFQNSINRENLLEHTCSVCAELKENRDMHPSLVPADDPMLQKLRYVYPEGCPNPFEDDIYLSKLVIDPRGVFRSTDQNIATLQICKRCFKTLHKGKHLPRLSLANGLFLGPVPNELKDLTVVEEALIARRRSKCWVIHLKDSDLSHVSSTDMLANHVNASPVSQRGFKGHIIVYPSHPENLDNILPAPISDTITRLCVVFVGSSRPTNEWLRTKARPLLVRREKVRAALMWLKSNNPLYADVIINDDVLNELPDEDVLPVDIHFEEHVTESESEELNMSDTCDNNSSYDRPTLFQNAVVSDIDGHDVTTTEIRNAAINHLKHGGGFIQMPHDPTPTNEYIDYDMFPCTFPTLFPYGIGGYRHPDQRESISMENYARHLFALTDRRFQEHYSFLFIIFNILQRRKVARSGKYKMSQSSFPDFAKKLTALSDEALKSMVNKTSNGDVPTADNEQEQLVLQLMKEANLVNTHVPGTASSRKHMRNQIRGMIMDQGLPSFFVTVNPADIYSPVVRFMTRNEMEKQDVNFEDLPDYWDQALSIAKNPFVAAKFFDCYMQNFIKHILAYDPTRKFANDGGVFGHVKAYYGTVEAQGRGTLHCHMLVWLQGALDPQEIKDRVLANGDLCFRDKLIDFLNDAISNELPANPGEDVILPFAKYHACAVPVPNGGFSGKQQQKDFRRLVEECQLHTHTASCFKYCKNASDRECRYNLNESKYIAQTTMNMENGELTYRVLNGMINGYNPAMLQALRCNVDVKFVGSGAAAKAILYYITDYITKTQLKTHTGYVALLTAVRKLQSQRNDDSDHIVAGKRMLVKCANGLISKQELSAPQVASYLLNIGDFYCSHKHRSLYWTSFEKYVKQMSSVESSDHETLSNGVEATFTDMEDTVEFDEVTIEKSRDGTLYAVANQVMDYIYRGQEFQNMCVWDFVAGVSKIDIEIGDPNDNDELTYNEEVVDDTESAGDRISDRENEYENSELNEVGKRGRKRNVRSSFTFGHPQRDSHILRMMNENCRRIPVPIGPKIYRRDRADFYEEYCRLMLILFKPWNKIDDLRNTDESWSTAFGRFEIEMNPCTKKIINNIQRLHECKDSRDEHFAKRHRNGNRLLTSEITLSTRDDGLNLENYEDNDIADAIEHFQDIDNICSNRIHCENIEIESALQAASLGGLITCSSMYEDHPAGECSSVNSTLVDGIQSTNLIEKEWHAWYERRKSQFKAKLMEHHETHLATTSLRSSEMSLPLISSCQTTLDSIHPCANEGLDDPYTQEEGDAAGLIEDTIQDYTLNEEQARAFKLVAEHSINSHSRSWSNVASDPLLLYIGGPGGTGKSRIVNALKSFFARKGEERRLRLSSFMGVAAHNICGMTLHSLLSLTSLRKKKNSNRTKEELIKTWAGVDYLFVDEISMVGCQLLSDISEALSIAKQCTDLPFGGINMIFCGDFCQLRPVGDKSLYEECNGFYLSPADEQTNSGQRKIKGRMLWLELTHCVMLTQQMRQSGFRNIRFRQLLERLRMGNCNKEDYDLLNSRLLGNVGVEEVSKWRGAPIITTQNAVKDALNVQCCQSYASMTNWHVQWYYAKDLHKGKVVENTELKESLYSLHSGKTNQSLGKLPLIEGMPVIITHNFDVSGGVVNGTRGILKSVRYELNKTETASPCPV